MYSTKKTNNVIIKNDDKDYIAKLNVGKTTNDTKTTKDTKTTNNNNVKKIHIRNNYLNNFLYDVNNPSKDELAQYGKVIFKYNTKEVK